MRYPLLLRALGCIALLLPASPGLALPTTTNVDVTITVFAAIAFSPAPVAFGDQQIGHSASQSVTVSNSGSVAFSPSVSLATGTNSGEFSLSNGCGASIAPGGTCQISVAFSPTTAGSANSGITVAGSGRSYGVQISGNGTVAPPAPTPQSIALSPASIQIADNATGGSIVSRATVTMSDGSSANCTLSTSDTSYYTISGMNVVLAHGLTGADDGQHNTQIGVVSCP